MFVDNVFRGNFCKKIALKIIKESLKQQRKRRKKHKNLIFFDDEKEEEGRKHTHTHFI